MDDSAQMALVPVGSNGIGNEAVRKGGTRLDGTLCGVWYALHPQVVHHVYTVPVYSQGFTVQTVSHCHLHLQKEKGINITSTYEILAQNHQIV